MSRKTKERRANSTLQRRAQAVCAWLTYEILSYVDLDELGRALAEIAGLKP